MNFKKHFILAIILLLLISILYIVFQYLFGFLLIKLLNFTITLEFATLGRIYKVASNLNLKFPSNILVPLFYWLGYLAPLFFVGAIVAGIFLKPKKALYGDTRFARIAEIAKQKLLAKIPAKDSVILGKINNKFISLKGQISGFIAAAPRSGKGVAIVIMNLLNYVKGSVVVMDVKYENFIKTSGFRKKFSKVFLLDFSGNFPYRDGHYLSASWNPFSYVSSDPKVRQKDIRNIANIIFANQLVGHDKFFGESAVNLFVAIAMLMFDIGEKVTFANIQSKTTFDETFKNFPEYIKNLIAIYRYQISEDTNELLLKFASGEAKTMSNILSTFNAGMTIFSDPRIAAITSKDSFDLRELRKQLLSIYIGVLPTETGTYAPLLNLFFSQLIHVQVEEGLPENNSELKYQCMLMIDEFAALGRVKILQESIAFIPGYNLILILIFQNLAQVYEIYGKDAAQNLLSCLYFQVVFAAQNQEDAEAQSAYIGYHSEVIANKSRQIGGKNRSKSLSDSEQKRALMLPDELKRMNPEDCIIILPHQLPIQAKKCIYYEDKLTKHHANLRMPAINEVNFNYRDSIRINREPNINNLDVGVILSNIFADTGLNIENTLKQLYPAPKNQQEGDKQHGNT